jgi:imidazoleglycerol phosphate dehydratase HisB
MPAKCNLNIKAEGDNEHHKIESIFKAFAKSIKMAVAVMKTVTHCQQRKASYNERRGQTCLKPSDR